MSSWLLRVGSSIGAAALVVVAAAQAPAAAQGGGGQYGSTKEKTESGTITISSRYIRWVDGRHSLKIGSPARPDPSAPVCRYFRLDPAGSRALGKGGPEPGAWYVPACQWPNGYVGDPMPAVWIVGPPPAPPANPTVLAQRAAATLALGGSQIGMSPPPNRPQIVNVSTWLWIKGAWRGRSATARAGPVTATAKAVPYKVVWSMGDGHTVTCFGPGTPYNPRKKASAQSTNCSYTYSAPSSSVPGGRYAVTATVYYRVTWVAVGAPGGGNLGLVAGPTARTTVLVEQAEALNTSG